MLDRVRSYVILKPREFGREQLFLTKEVMKRVLWKPLVLSNNMLCFCFRGLFLTPEDKNNTCSNLWMTNVVPTLENLPQGEKLLLYSKHPRNFGIVSFYFWPKEVMRISFQFFVVYLITCCAAVTMVVFESGKWKMYVSQLINDQLGTPCCKIYFGVKIYFDLLYPKIDFEW